jgi:hypothetical protein
MRAVDAVDGPRFAAQVAAVVSLFEAPSCCGKTAAVAKEVMAVKYGNTTGHSIKKFFESPFAGKHPKLISKGTKEAAAEAAVTAAEAIAVADLEQANRLAAEFEALVGGALTMALAQRPNPGPLARVLVRTRAAPDSEARSIHRAGILTSYKDAKTKRTFHGVSRHFRTFEVPPKLDGGKQSCI